MTPCPECKRDVSQRAPVCPGCGCPLPDAHVSAPVASAEGAGAKFAVPASLPAAVAILSGLRMVQEIERRYTRARTWYLFWRCTHYTLLAIGIAAAFLVTGLGAKSWYDDKPAIQPRGEGAPLITEDRAGWSYTVRWMAGLGFLGGVATLLHRGLGVEKNMRCAQYDTAAIDRIRALFLHPTKPDLLGIYAEFLTWLAAKEADAKSSSEAAVPSGVADEPTGRRSKPG
jgi:hypothetical protein